MSFQPSGVLTLTTDCGTRGPYVGVLHGAMLAQHPTARIVDLTHEVEVHWPAEAGFWIERAYRTFPPGTVHVAVVESVTGRDRAGIVVVTDGHAFVGPDNGLLAGLADREGAATYAISSKVVASLGRREPSPTFRGRDAQGPVGGALAAGKLDPSAIGPSVKDYAPSLLEPPLRTKEGLQGVVVTVDGFGNVISNLTRADVESLGPSVVSVAGRGLSIKRSYADGQPGSLFALINAFDALEIARSEGSAADTLGVGRGAPVVLTPRTRISNG